MLKRLKNLFSGAKSIDVLSGGKIGIGADLTILDTPARSAELHKEQGNKLIANGDISGAEACYRQSIWIDPLYVPAYCNLGVALEKQKRFDEAMVCYQKALAINPEFATVYFNMGLWHMAQGNIDEQMRCYEKALSLKPDYCDARVNLGFALQEQCEFGNAERHYRGALVVNPDHPVAQFNLALLLLLAGDYSAGFQLYETRFHEGVVHDPYDQQYQLGMLATFSGMARWMGEDLRGKALIVWCEQGLGDSLMMLRFIKGIAEKGMRRLSLYCRPELARIVQNLPYEIDVIDIGSAVEYKDYDYHCPLMSLPYLLGVTTDTVPVSVPYLYVPNEMRTQWVSRLSTADTLKVGLVWAGSKRQGKDPLRSLALGKFESLVKIPGLTIVSLQRGEAADELKELDWPVLNWMEECEDLLDTGALIDALDIVISVDTSIVHLAGALGKQVWLLNRFESEWRWMLEVEDSLWYPTMRIFRQPALHDWDSVVRQLAKELVSAVSCI